MSEETVKAITEIAESLSGSSKDDLAELAKALADSQLDTEKLERLSKLARKAMAEKLMVQPVAYHY
jgi:cation transport regulator ChaC